MVGWDARAARARKLAIQHPSTCDVLTFYAGLAAYQQSLQPFPPSTRPFDLPFSAAIDLDAALAAVPGFLDWLPGMAPTRLAEAATEAGRLSPAVWRDLMQRHLAHEDPEGISGDDRIGFIVEAVLQPFAEAVAIGLRGGVHRTERQPEARPSRCPVCGGVPGVGVLREEGQGARRTLVCTFCFTEWEYLRVVCPACDEQRFDALPVYTADAVSHARVDACDSCRRYLKTIDLTKDGLADPMVDDLATLPLDLWAREQGYQRLRPNLLRL